MNKQRAKLTIPFLCTHNLSLGPKSAGTCMAGTIPRSRFTLFSRKCETAKMRGKISYPDNYVLIASIFNYMSLSVEILIGNLVYFQDLLKKSFTPPSGCTSRFNQHTLVVGLQEHSGSPAVQAYPLPEATQHRARIHTGHSLTYSFSLRFCFPPTPYSVLLSWLSG